MRLRERAGRAPDPLHIGRGTSHRRERSEYKSLWIGFAKERVHVWRLKAELGDAKDSEQSLWTDVPLPSSQLTEIVKLETDNLGARQANHQREKEFLQRPLKQGATYPAAAVPFTQDEKSAPDIAIIRKSNKGLLHLAGSEEAELQPGDVVEVTVHRTAATQ